MSTPNSPSLGSKLLHFLSGMRLASVLLLLLLVLTWFGTLEQVEQGLYNTIQKYFTWKSFIVLPEINGKIVPLPMPGAYWVSALLFINMTLGGLIKIRKSPKYIGVMTSHFGILLLLLGGFVTHHFSKRGNMALYEGESSNYAQSYHDHVIEVSELNPEGEVQTVHLIDTSELKTVFKKGSEPTSFEFAQLPFRFDISHYLKNCRPVRVGPVAAGQTPTVDGFTLMQQKLELADEANLNGCYVKAYDESGSEISEFLLFSASFNPYILSVGEQKYAVTLRKKLWKMPFTVSLDDFNAEFFVGTGRPKKFESYIRRIEEGREETIKIWMNNPMRYLGYTFFQASWGPQDGAPDRQLYSVFEIVKNPSDQWPLYSILVTTFGLLGHFGFMLARHITKQTKKS